MLPRFPLVSQNGSFGSETEGSDGTETDGTETDGRDGTETEGNEGTGSEGTDGSDWPVIFAKSAAKPLDSPAGASVFCWAVTSFCSASRAF